MRLTRLLSGCRGCGAGSWRGLADTHNRGLWLEPWPSPPADGKVPASHHHWRGGNCGFAAVGSEGAKTAPRKILGLEKTFRRQKWTQLRAKKFHIQEGRVGSNNLQTAEDTFKRFLTQLDWSNWDHLVLPVKDLLAPCSPPTVTPEAL